MPQTEQHVRKRLPKWTPKSMKNRWKSGSGHTCHHWASLWHPWEGSGGTPGTKMYQNVKKMLVQNLLRKEKERCCLKTFLLASFFSAADWAKPTWIILQINAHLTILQTRSHSTILEIRTHSMSLFHWDPTNVQTNEENISATPTSKGQKNDAVWKHSC